MRWALPSGTNINLEFQISTSISLSVQKVNESTHIVCVFLLPLHVIPVCMCVVPYKLKSVLVCVLVLYSACWPACWSAC